MRAHPWENEGTMILLRGMRRGILLTLLAVAGGAFAVPLALGQNADRPSSSRSAPPDSVARIRAESRQLLQQLYREVYELQLEIARVDSEVDRERLIAARRQLVSHIREVRARLEAAEALGEDVPAPEPPSELPGIARELEDLGVDADWESIGRIFEDNAQNLGRGLSELGRQLEDIEIDVDEETGRVEIDTRQGGRIQFEVPDEVRTEISAGLAQMRQELQRVLSDSNRGNLPGELRILLDELPSDLKDAWNERRGPPERHVVAQNVMKIFADFEVAEDEIVAGDLVLLGGDAYVAGEVQGNTWVLFGDVLVEGRGEVAQDAVSVGGEVLLLDEASRVKGRMLDASSVLPGTGITTFTTGGGSSWAIHSVRVATLALLLLLGFAVAGDRVERVVDHGLRNLGHDFSSGLLWFPAALGGFVVASVGLAISVIGIPVVIVLTVVFVVIVTLAYFAACTLVGRLFFRLFADEDGRSDWIYALIGLALLELPALAALTASGTLGGASMALHMIDYLVKFLALALGFGSIVATRVGGRREPEPELSESPPALAAGSES